MKSATKKKNLRSLFNYVFYPHAFDHRTRTPRCILFSVCSPNGIVLPFH